MVCVLKVIIDWRKYENNIEFDKIMETNSKNVITVSIFLSVLHNTLLSCLWFIAVCLFLFLLFFSLMGRYMLHVLRGLLCLLGKYINNRKTENSMRMNWRKILWSYLASSYFRLIFVCAFFIQVESLRRILSEQVLISLEL